MNEPGFITDKSNLRIGRLISNPYCHRRSKCPSKASLGLKPVFLESCRLITFIFLPDLINFIFFFRSTELFVNIKRATDLSLKSSAYVSFNFVQVELDPFSAATSAMGERNETRRVRNSVCPVFNDVIRIQILPNELKKQTLICSVFDENRISPRDLIGVARLELGSVFKQIYGTEKEFSETLEWRTGVRIL